MNLYTVQPDTRFGPNYELEGSHTWSLPGVRCSVCASSWGAVGACYPDFDLRAFPNQKRVKATWPIPSEDIRKLQKEIRELTGTRLPLRAGTDLGPFVGKGHGEFGDFAWHHSWTVFLKPETGRALSAKGIRGLKSVRPSVKLRGKRE